MRESVRDVCVGLVIVVALGSCYPGDQLTVEEADVVVTLFDQGTDFASLSTYEMPDTIVHLVDEDQEDNIRRDFDAQILDRIAGHMAALGFTRVALPGSADAIMLVAVTAREQIGYTGGYGWGGYWGWYYPYPPGWGWGWYPWYGGGGTIYTYRTGTLFMDLLDPAAADSTEEKVPTAWIAALNGLIEGNQVEERIDNGIDQAFAQSPYLGAGK